MVGGLSVGREKGIKRFEYWAEGQRWIWDKVKDLRSRFDVGDGIDVIADALNLYEKHLEDMVRDEHGQA
ncbi:hypothetical protein ES708_19988 [subsurface metagenome]